MKTLNIAYTLAIVLLLAFASYEAYKNDKKLIAVLSGFIAVMTAYYSFHKKGLSV